MAAATTIAPRVRLIPRPASEPPFDDEVTGSGHNPVQGSLALDFRLVTGVPAVPRAPRQLSLVPSAPNRRRGASRVPAPGSTMAGVADVAAARSPELTTDADTAAVAEFCARRTTSSGQLPDARQWSAMFVQAVVEVLAGVRPVTQLVRWTDDRVYADLALRTSNRIPSAPRAPKTSARFAAPQAPRVRVRSLRLCEPADGVVEATAVVERGQRCRAFALRLEGLDGRWRCTVLQTV